MKHLKKIIAGVSIVAIMLAYPNIALADAIDSGANNHTGATAIGFGDTLNGRDYMCQGFIMSQYNQITSVGFNINGKNADTNIGRKVWIDTTADLNSVPLGAVAVGIGGGTEITNATLVTGVLTKYVLTSSVNVTIGNKYVLCMAPWNTTTHVWTSDYQDIITSTANPYANGRRTHGDAAYTTWAAPDAGNDDILFDIYGQTFTATKATANTTMNGAGNITFTGNGNTIIN